MNLCEKTKELLVLFAEDELMPKDTAMVEKHLAECESCRIELEKYQNIMNNLVKTEYTLPASYSGELIVNINEKLDSRRARKFKLAPAISFVTVLLVLSVSFLLKNDMPDINNIISEEYQLYKQYMTATYFYNSTILEESEEIASELLPKDYITSSQEYLLEKSIDYSKTIVEVFDQMDEETFDEIINNLKNMEI